jgi:hypothetical protein
MRVGKNLKIFCVRNQIESLDQFRGWKCGLAGRKIHNGTFHINADSFLSVGFQDIMMNLPARSLRGKTRESICHFDRFPHANFPKEEGMDGSVDRSNPKSFKALGRESMLAKEMVAQVTSSINVGSVVHMIVSIDVGPPDLIGF